MKHKGLYKILCLVETITMTTLAMFCLIYALGEPIGDYTLKIFVLKIIAMIGFFTILKIEE